jgi:hypothetical protein
MTSVFKEEQALALFEIASPAAAGEAILKFQNFATKL